MRIKLLLIVLLNFGAFAQNESYVLSEGNEKLFEFADYVDVGANSYAIEQFIKLDSLSYKPITSENYSVGFSEDNFWVRFRLQNNGIHPKKLYLVTAKPITDVANLYQIMDSDKINHYKSGDQIPFSERQVEHRATVFSFTIPPNTTNQFYLHLRSDGENLNLPLNLYTESTFWRYNYTQQLVLGIFYGILLLAFLVYLFFYSSLREKSFLYYGLYVFFIGCMQASLDGLVFENILFAGGFLNSRAVLITAIFTNYFLLKYCEYYLRITAQVPKLLKFYRISYVLMAVALALVFISPKTLAWAYPYCNIIGLFTLILIFYTIFYMRFKDIRIDRYFTAGMVFLVLALLGFVLNNLSLLPNNVFVVNSAKIGTGLEIIFLSLSMTNLIRKLRMQKEQSQTLALQKSEEISELKTYFMGNMSHELRTPLNAIIGIAEMELSKLGNNEQRQHFETIKNASLSLLSNVNDILDFEKIEKNELYLKNEEFNPSITLHQISNNWKLEALNKGLSYRFEMDDEIPARLIGDCERFVQIINNVLGNAVKFTEKGGILFKLRSTPMPNGYFSFSFYISDTGIGMNPDFRKNIFDSFSQMRSNHKRQFGGIGLGLSIVNHLVKLYKGTITIESTEGSGTEVFIQLNIKGATETHKRVVNSETVDSEVNRLHVLVVEDNILNQMVMRKMLGTYPNITFAVVGNGAEAIEALKKDIYNMVLMDLQMPIMDGYEATKLIRSGDLGPIIGNIPIIAVTADAMQETRQRVLEIGMNDYMTKPIDREVLIQKMTVCSRGYLKIA